MTVRDEIGETDEGVTSFGMNFGGATRLIMILRLIAVGDFDSLRFLVRDADFSRRVKIVDSNGLFVTVDISGLTVELSRVRLDD